MIDWRHGGWTGSINYFAKREMHEQLSKNYVARRVRYGIFQRGLRRFFGSGNFSRFIGLYLAIDVIIVMAEAITVWYIPNWSPQESKSSATLILNTKSMMLDVSGYLLGAQIGLLGVISLALALVTLIAQREGSSTDVQVYYYESFSFELVASCVALAAILCMQLLWPLQFLLHLAGLGTNLQIFKLGLLGLHLTWLLVNLAAVAYFISTTFRFVQQSTREMLRNRYTANVVLPRDLKQRLRVHLYKLASKDLVDSDDDADHGQPSVTFGFDYGEPRIIEIETTFRRPMALHDVRVTWVRWVLKRWSVRCINTASQKPISNLRGGVHQKPLIWFSIHIDQPLKGKIGWCRRRGGVPLNKIEIFVLRRAFRFRSSLNED